MSDQVQVNPKLVRSNQAVNPMRGLWRRESEMEVKSRVVQLCIVMSTWSMVAIFELRRIQVKRKIVRIMTRIRHEGRRSFRGQKTDKHEE